MRRQTRAFADRTLIGLTERDGLGTASEGEPEDSVGTKEENRTRGGVGEHTILIMDDVGDMICARRTY